MRKDPLQLDVAAPAARPFDASRTLTPGAQRAIGEAQELARALGSPNMESAHLLLGALQLDPPDAQLTALLQLSGLKADEVGLYAQAALTGQSSLAPGKSLSSSVRAVLRLAGREAQRTDCALIDVSHFFVACFRPQSDSNLPAVLAPLGVSADQLSLHLRQLTRSQNAQLVKDESPLAQLTAQGERALEAAQLAMRAGFCGRISTLHLLIGILENPDSDAVAALQTLMIDVNELKQRAAVAATSDGEIAGPTRRFTPAAKRALDRAKAAAREGNRSHIGSGDLLLGLLRQPLLLIERAQFGACPDDPAAALLREVDADLVRAIFNPQGAATAPAMPAKPRATPDDARDLRLRMFVILFCIQAVAWNLADAARLNRNLESLVVLLVVATMIGSGLITCGVLLFSKSATRKANWQWGFVGAIAGMMVGLAISGAL